MKKNKIKNNKVDYHKPKKRPVKIYEIDVTLSRDGKSYKAYVPAYATEGVIKGLNHIVDYMRKYQEINFDVYCDPVM